MRRTKIVCTLGPATDQQDVLEQLIKGGMNVARMNFSHGSYEEHEKRMDSVRQMREKCGKNVAILLDTKGPEIRTGDFEGNKVSLHTGQEFTLVCGDVMGDATKSAVTYADMYKDVKPGMSILIDDGLIELRVEKIEGKEVHCTVLNDGDVSNHKGINIPDAHLNMEYLSTKDKNDILFGISQNVDFIAASFVRTADDVKMLKNFLKENGGENIHVISKIENREGVDNIDAIIEASDGIMIARGDMGVELPEEEVPIVQKMIIKKSYGLGKQVITATQMLDSMMKNPRPTRAETTDVANAIYDGTSAIMLSGETAAGKFPVKALETMVRIAERTEQDINYKQRFFSQEHNDRPDITDAISHATCTSAYDLNASAIVTVTKSGRSARMISRYRPGCQIIAGSTDEKVCRQLSLSWGVTPILLEEKHDVFDLFDHAISEAKDKGLIQAGELTVITSGVPIDQSGTTNMIKVQIVGE